MLFTSNDFVKSFKSLIDKCESGCQVCLFLYTASSRLLKYQHRILNESSVLIKSKIPSCECKAAIEILYRDKMKSLALCLHCASYGVLCEVINHPTLEQGICFILF